HLFSAFFAVELLAAVVGNLLGGWVPVLLRAVPALATGDLFHAYRDTLVLGAMLEVASVLVLTRLAGLAEAPAQHASSSAEGARHSRILTVVAVTALLTGAGAGLIIPFMNLYFKSRFACSSGQIGMFFSLAQVSTAIASL